MPTTSGGLNVTYPNEGSTGWYSTWVTLMNALSSHPHDGVNGGALLAADTIASAQIRFANNTDFNMNNAAGTETAVFKYNASDIFEILVNAKVTGNLTVTGTAAITGAVTLTTALTVPNGGTGLTTATTGDLIYASASNTLNKLAIGSTGQNIEVASGVPAWYSSGKWKKIQAQSASASASLSFTSGFATYTRIKIEMKDIIAATDTAYLTLQGSTDGGSTWKTTSGDYVTEKIVRDSGSLTSSYNATATSTWFVSSIDNTNSISFDAELSSFNTVGKYTVLKAMNEYLNGSGAALFELGGTLFNFTGCNALKFAMSSGNITSGTITLYGWSD